MLKPFFIRYNKLLVRVFPDDVMCLSTEGNYTRIHMQDKTYYMVRSTLSSALKKLPQDIFIKVHRSYVANIYYIVSIDRDHIMVNDRAMPVGRQYYKGLVGKLDVIE